MGDFFYVLNLYKLFFLSFIIKVHLDNKLGIATMKNYAIRRLYSYFEITTQDIGDGKFDEKLQQLDDEIKVLFEKYGLNYISQDTRFLNLKKMAVSKCEQCENLMLNRDINPMRFNREDLWVDLDCDYNCVIWDGGTHEGKNLCMECLPIEHRWGYHS